MRSIKKPRYTCRAWRAPKTSAAPTAASNGKQQGAAAAARNAPTAPTLANAASALGSFISKALGAYVTTPVQLLPRPAAEARQCAPVWIRRRSSCWGVTSQRNSGFPSLSRIWPSWWWRQRRSRRITNEIERRMDAIANGVKLAQRGKAFLENATAALGINVLLQVAGQRGAHCDLVRGQMLWQPRKGRCFDDGQ